MQEKTMSTALWRKKAERLLASEEGATLYALSEDGQPEEIEADQIGPNGVFAIATVDEDGEVRPIIQVRTTGRPERAERSAYGPPMGGGFDGGGAGLIMAHLPRNTQQLVESYERLALMHERQASAANEQVEKLRKEKRELEDQLAKFDRGDGEHAEIAAVLGDMLMQFLNRQDRKALLVTLNERILARLPENASKEEVARIMAGALEEGGEK
jgi:hypothetical protein